MKTWNRYKEPEKVLNEPEISQHTPTPWKVNRDEIDYVEIITNENPFFTVAKVTGGDMREARANAAFIVKAVNCHEELIKALNEVDDLLVDLVRTMDKDHIYHDRILEASTITCRTIAKAADK